MKVGNLTCQKQDNKFLPIQRTGFTSVKGKITIQEYNNIYGKIQEIFNTIPGRFNQKQSRNLVKIFYSV
jgi:hypothetical protein